MPHDWDHAIKRMDEVKHELSQVDTRAMYPLYPPEFPAQEKDIVAVEAAMGERLDLQYRNFLRIADGWRHLYGKVHLFGTRELRDSAEMAFAHLRLDQLDLAGELEKSGIRFDDALPIAGSPHDIDLFVLLRPDSPAPGTVIWFARDEIERYSDFAGFFKAMIDANSDLITMLRFTDRHLQYHTGV